MKTFAGILLISIAGGLVLALFRYDDGCLEFSHKWLVASLNVLIVMGVAAASTRIWGRSMGRSMLRFGLIAVPAGALTAALAMGLSIAVVQPLTAPEPLRASDYLYVFFIPGLLFFLLIAYVLMVQSRARDFARALEARAVPSESGDGEDEYLELPGEKGPRRVPVREILYVSSHGKKSSVHTRSGDFQVNTLLKDIAARFPGSLARIHKSHLANPLYISEVKYQFGGTYSLLLNDEDDTNLPVGRTYLSNLRRLLQETSA